MDAIARLTASLSDRYRLERELGQGGMATVYLAEDLKHGRKVAIKVLHPELSAVIGGDRFLSEIKTTASLQHPHILGLIDSGEADGLLYYVMPFIEGETLRARLNREKQLPIGDAVRLTKEVASALEFAHKRGIIHRDIKPENVLLQDGQALVADFGIALAVQQAGGTRMTQTGMSLGTPAYMSPEQAMGEREIGARSDVYALGAMTYEMLTGEPPFTGPNSQAIVAKVLTEQPPPLGPKRPSVPPGVEEAVLIALQKLPADRFGTAKEFADALDGSGRTAGRQAGKYAATVAMPAVRVARRGRLAALLAATAVISAAVAWFLRPAPRQPASWQYITFGDAAPFQMRLPGAALSPDGATLVYASGVTPFQLQLKRRGQLKAAAIPGTDNAIYPTFSPDGEWIAFVADGRLKKIRPDGSASFTLTDSAFATFGGAAWLDDGTLVFVGPSITGLSRISAKGGPVTRVLQNPALAGLGIGSPTPLPGARGVLFTVCNSGCVTMALHVLDLRTGNFHKLLDDVAMGWYLPIGQLLYLRRDGTALMAPFNLDRLETTGPATPALEGVYTNLGRSMLAWSTSGTLVYLQGSGNSNEIDVVRVGRNGAVEMIDSAWHGGFNSLAVSPNGKQIAVGAGLASGTLGIWIKELDHGPFTRLTFGGLDRRPAWSPDGQTVAFIRDTVGGSSVFARRADGSTAEKALARFDRAAQEVTWSPDGQWILVRTDNGAAGAGDIVGVRTTGDTTKVSLVASEFTELHPAISPDGHWLAYTSNESGINEVFVRPFPGVNAGRWQVSTGGGEQPRWSPDGKELFYMNLDTGHFTAAGLRLSPRFEVVDRRVLFTAPPFDIDPYHTSFDVLPNGRGFLFMLPRAMTQLNQTSLVQAENWFEDLRIRLKR